MDETDELELRAAVRDLLGDSEPGQYESRRRQAWARGSISIGRQSVPAFKRGRQWRVRRFDVVAAQERERLREEDLAQVTRDYERGIVHGSDGETVETAWGGYRIAGDFRFVWNDVEVIRRRSDGSWWCNHCNLSTMSEHNRPECHTCADWGSCRRDCTLSRIECPACGRAVGV